MYDDKTDEKLVEEAGGYRETDSAPVEMMRRLKESTKNLNKSITKLDETTSRYSRKLLDLTILLFIIGLIQVFISLRAITKSWGDWGALSLLVFYFIYLVVSYLFKKDKQKISKN